MTKIGVTLAGVLAGWAVTVAVRRLLDALAGGETLVTAILASVLLLACTTAGGITALRRYNLHRTRHHAEPPS